MSEGYNGWANYETWNVALWIGNDEGLYSMAREYCKTYSDWRGLMASMPEQTGEPAEIYYQTPDNVAWNDSGLDIEALDEMIVEL